METELNKLLCCNKLELIHHKTLFKQLSASKNNIYDKATKFVTTQGCVAFLLINVWEVVESNLTIITSRYYLIYISIQAC